MLADDGDHVEADDGGTSPGEFLVRQVCTNGFNPAPDEDQGEAVDRESLEAHETARGTAYAAVTAHLAGDKQTVSDCVYGLLRNPMNAAAAFIVLIIACGALAELWGRAIREEPAKAWSIYASAVARGVSHYKNRHEPGA